MAASKIEISDEHHGLARIHGVPSYDCYPVMNRLLQKNHDDINIFFRPAGGHNHTVHAILTVFALGGGPKDFERAFADNDHQQIPLVPIDSAIVEQMNDNTVFLDHMQDPTQYGNFLRFFEQKIEARGWKEVLLEYCFSFSKVAETMFMKLFEGLYHPLIHIGFGIEFAQPAIIAEGLAQAASHEWGNIDEFFALCEKLGKSDSEPSIPLRDLYSQVRASETIRTASKVQQGPNRIRDGLMPQALNEVVAVAAKFRVSLDQIDRGVVETTSCAALSASSAQRKGKAVKIDFFSMHAVTSSIFLSLLAQTSWIPVEQRARLVEWKGRLDLVWYASCAAPELDLQHITSYQPTLSKDLNWRKMYEMTAEANDDGHVAKFVRALYSAECESRRLEEQTGIDSTAHLPITGDLWFRVAQMCIDSTSGVPLDDKWLMGAGYDPVWVRVPDTPTSIVV